VGLLSYDDEEILLVVVVVVVVVVAGTGVIIILLMYLCDDDNDDVLLVILVLVNARHDNVTNRILSLLLFYMGNDNVRRVVLFDALTLPFASIKLKGSLLVPISNREDIIFICLPPQIWCASYFRWRCRKRTFETVMSTIFMILLLMIIANFTYYLSDFEAILEILMMSM